MDEGGRQRTGDYIEQQRAAQQGGRLHDAQQRHRCPLQRRVPTAPAARPPQPAAALIQCTRGTHLVMHRQPHTHRSCRRSNSRSLRFISCCSCTTRRSKPVTWQEAGGVRAGSGGGGAQRIQFTPCMGYGGGGGRGALPLRSKAPPTLLHPRTAPAHLLLQLLCLLARRLQVLALLLARRPGLHEWMPARRHQTQSGWSAGRRT